MILTPVRALTLLVMFWLTCTFWHQVTDRHNAGGLPHNDIPDIAHDTRVVDWLGRSGAMIKTCRSHCVLNSHSLEAAAVHRQILHLVLRSASSRGF